MEAEAEGRADRAGRIAGEVEKDLSGEGDHAHPGVERDERSAVTKDSVGGAGEHGVGQNDFLEQAQSHERQTPKKTPCLRPWRSEQLRQKISGAHDWTGDQLREERNGENEITQRFRRLHHAAIDVQSVGKRMERVERNPDRQQNIQVRWLIDDPDARHQPLEVLEQEVPVFEEPQHAQIHADTGDQPDPPGMRPLRAGDAAPSQKSIAVVEKSRAANGGFQAP